MFDKLFKEMKRKPPQEFPIDTTIIDEYCKLGTVARKIVKIEITVANRNYKGKSKKNESTVDDQLFKYINM